MRRVMLLLLLLLRRGVNWMLIFLHDVYSDIYVNLTLVILLLIKIGCCRLLLKNLNWSLRRRSGNLVTRFWILFNCSSLVWRLFGLWFLTCGKLFSWGITMICAFLSLNYGVTCLLRLLFLLHLWLFLLGDFLSLRICCRCQQLTYSVSLLLRRRIVANIAFHKSVRERIVSRDILLPWFDYLLRNLYGWLF